MCSKKLRNIHRWEGENDTKLSLILAVAIHFIVRIDTLMDVECAQKAEKHSSMGTRKCH
jgi:hypothetical protein